MVVSAGFACVFEAFRAAAFFDGVFFAADLFGLPEPAAASLANFLKKSFAILRAVDWINRLPIKRPRILQPMPSLQCWPKLENFT